MRTLATTLAVVMMLALTLGMVALASSVPESFAQGNATTYGNQTSGANNTGLSNQTSANDTGSVSGFER